MQTDASNLPSTLGDLKSSGWISRPVKDEIRENLMRAIALREPLFPGIFGYDHSVIPQIRHALLARHDILLLGLRGQAKTRLLRSLVHFLDEYMPVVQGSEINDDPYGPISPHAKQLVAELGDDVPIAWVHRDRRYVEKLATPDTTVADLIGDIDPIKAATRKLDLSSEFVIHYGLIPRSNRGIFAINELPDLQPRIQVALLNIMQERDIQIRGFNIRFPLDVSLVFSANPEDYTNRGNIITPLKDRIDAQVITHYPKDVEVGMTITEQESWVSRGAVDVSVPYFMRQLIEQIAFEARDSEYVDQKSGVSARLTITAMEHMVSAAENRALHHGEKSTVTRVADLFHSVPAITGKLELVYEGEQEGAIQVAKHLIGKAVSVVFRQYAPYESPKPLKESGSRSGRQRDEARPSLDKALFSDVMDWFSKGNTVDLPDTLSQTEYAKRLNQVGGLRAVAARFSAGTDAETLSMMDFVLEALHQHSMLGKTDLHDGRSFSDMLGSMLTNLDFDDLDD